jgi:hypothetical protein
VRESDRSLCGATPCIRRPPSDGCLFWLQEQLAAQKEHYDTIVRELQGKLVAAQKATTKPEPGPSSSAEAQSGATVDRLQSQMKLKEQQIAGLDKDIMYGLTRGCSWSRASRLDGGW